MKSQGSKDGVPPGHAKNAPQNFALEEFLPYRLALLSSLVSRSIQRLYTAEFDISIPEWRIVAILGSGGPMTANDIRGRAAMDKVQVSRAAAKLSDAGHIERRTDPADRRRTTLSLSPSGLNIYNHIVPMALEREAFLQSALSENERDDLIKLLEKLTKRAVDMTSKPVL
ncbi:MarR family winged helix-turn-helix transcriptional regulator [Nisaea acidiphila]|uniref:MarR family winged helix-turn-helix transcriptional regulator n=1 Tax=Nisaea acidiphila TaxID=1862145 RepID=A0A9J7AUT9_9PROT|nr:MarR family winged helix-turn-helix transcriptional regulator [Nisaea acidiphila]UUX49173.1 MarR family winged helix-turn-helix transcriptional regulator [Nisaea acidiphila]